MNRSTRMVCVLPEPSCSFMLTIAASIGTYRSSVFYNTIGPEFIPIALRAARKADPKAKLYINDYNIEWVGDKSDAMYNLAQNLVARGIPLDGVGFRTYLPLIAVLPIVL